MLPVFSLVPFVLTHKSAWGKCKKSATSSRPACSETWNFDSQTKYFVNLINLWVSSSGFFLAFFCGGLLRAYNKFKGTRFSQLSLQGTREKFFRVEFFLVQFLLMGSKIKCEKWQLISHNLCAVIELFCLLMMSEKP